MDKLLKLQARTSDLMRNETLLDIITRTEFEYTVLTSLRSLNPDASYILTVLFYVPQRKKIFVLSMLGLPVLVL